MKQFTSSSLVKHYWANQISFKSFSSDSKLLERFFRFAQLNHWLMFPLLSSSCPVSFLVLPRQPELFDLFTFVKGNLEKTLFCSIVNPLRNISVSMINRISNHLDRCNVSITWNPFIWSRRSASLVKLFCLAILFAIEAINRIDIFLLFEFWTTKLALKAFPNQTKLFLL